VSKQPVKAWKIVCDWPECKTDFEYGEWTFFGDDWEPKDMLSDGDWDMSPNGEKHYCPKHPRHWASDLSDGWDEEPERPYLLIHDGDTEDRNDDGYVTLVDERCSSCGGYLYTPGCVPTPFGPSHTRFAGIEQG
jgi:hypothetical protein